MNIKANQIASLTIDGERFRAAILAVTDKHVTYVDPEAPGVCVVPLEDVTKCTNHGEPQNDAEKVALGQLERHIEVKPCSQPAPAAPRGKKKSDGPTKLDQAIVILKEAGDISKDQLIQLFVDKLGMSKAGATTYFYAAKKAAK